VGVPDDPPAAPLEGPLQPSAEAALDAAVLAHQRGQRADARAALTELMLDPALAGTELLQRARLHMAELLLDEGDTPGAQRFLEQVLDDDSDFRPDPFRHPPHVIDQYNFVRALRGPPAEEPPPPPPPVAVVAPPTPWSAWSPFGTYHLRHDRRTRGILYSVGFSTTWAAAVMSLGVYAADRAAVPGTAEYDSLVRLRGVHWGLLAANWGVYAASVIDAQRHWRREGARAAVAPAVTGLPGGAAGGVQVRF
jgi:hypothetical protein